MGGEGKEDGWWTTGEVREVEVRMVYITNDATQHPRVGRSPGNDIVQLRPICIGAPRFTKGLDD
jgi:hypothetical protein